MATTLAKAYVQIVPSAEGIKGGIEEVLEPEARKGGSAAGKLIASSIKKILVGAGIGKALSSALTEGANLQQSIGGIETLFKDSADSMKKYASEAYKTAGISANQYMEQATSFSASLIGSLGGDTAKAAEVANQAIIDMSDNANKMGTSIESIQTAYQGFAKQNYTMLDNLKLGYGGTKSEMERLIADANRVKVANGEMATLSIDSFADVTEAIHIMQTELNITGSTSQEAEKTLSGSFNSMVAAAKNLLGNMALGENIVPSLKALVSTTSTFLLDNLLPMIGQIVMSIPTIVAEGVPSIMEKGKYLLGSLTMAIRNEFPKMIESGTKSITSFITGLMNNLPYLLFTGGNLLINLVNAIIEKMPLILDSAAKIIGSLVTGFINNLPKIIQTGVELILKLAAGLIKGIPKIIEKITEIYRKIEDKFSSMDWKDIGLNIIKGIIKGIKNSVTSLVAAAKEAAKSALKSVKNYLGIHSPSRVFETQVGKMISLGLAEGIEGNLKPVTNAMSALSNETLGMMNDDFNISRNSIVSYESQSNSVFKKMLDVLSSIESKTEKEFAFAINGRKLAYALGSDMNIVLNKLNNNESRRG